LAAENALKWLTKEQAERAGSAVIAAARSRSDVAVADAISTALACQAAVEMSGERFVEKRGLGAMKRLSIA
jgi:hypothetical protein